MFPVHGPSTATNPPSRPGRMPSSCRLADQWAPQIPRSPRRYVSPPLRFRAVSTRLMTTTLLVLDRGPLTAPKRWPERYIPTHSNNDRHHTRYRYSKNTSESSHTSQDSDLLCVVGCRAAPGDHLDVVGRQ